MLQQLHMRRKNRMTDQNRPFAAVQSIMTIAATIATPLLVAYFGWRIQSESTSQSIRKDYVQMSIAILKDGTKDEQLRHWAVSVVDANSPVKFSEGLRSDLAEGKTRLVPAAFPMPPPNLMAPPRRLKLLPDKKQITNGDVLINHVENMGIAHENAAQLWYLQQLISRYHDISVGKDPGPIKDIEYTESETGPRSAPFDSKPAPATTSAKQ
jgi:hypothetical protein